MWKLADVTPIFQKGNKQLINNYIQISLLPICDNFKIKCYLLICTHHLITKTPSGLMDLINEIHDTFESTESLKVRAVYLHISNAF